MRYPLLAKELSKRIRAIKGEEIVESFAHKCDIDVTTMYAMLNGENNMMDYNLLKICLHTGTPVAVLMDGLEQYVKEEHDTLVKAYDKPRPRRASRKPRRVTRNAARGKGKRRRGR